MGHGQHAKNNNKLFYPIFLQIFSVVGQTVYVVIYENCMIQST